MDNFDSIKNIWQKEQKTAPAPLPMSTAAHTAKSKIQKEHLRAGILLIITGCFILYMAVFIDFGFKNWYTFAAMGAVTLICFGQSTILFFNYSKIKSIKETAIPSVHLQKWQDYYSFRKKQTKWNGPLYFLLLNGAMGVYLIEAFRNMSMQYIFFFMVVYLSWMAYAYFILGKKVLKRETGRLNTIIKELEYINKQLQDS